MNTENNILADEKDALKAKIKALEGEDRKSVV